jgi:hypothetical protein
MADATGEIIETPTADLPFKAVISHDGKLSANSILPLG